ncbi:hypothetical protein ACFPK5_00820 [Streptomyces beijiangensis]
MTTPLLAATGPRCAGFPDPRRTLRRGSADERGGAASRTLTRHYL